MSKNESVQALLKRIRACRICEPHLPLGANPVCNFSRRSKILIVGQAPGTRVHHTGIPWNDPSGDRLREWLGVDRERFYDTDYFAIVPMGFCYPGKTRSGDAPPRPECSATWIKPILKQLHSRQLTVIIGQYAHRYYLGEQNGPTLTETVRNWRAHLPEFFTLPHPSPRNNLWLRKNPWFEASVIPELRSLIGGVLGGDRLGFRQRKESQ